LDHKAHEEHQGVGAANPFARNRGRRPDCRFAALFSATLSRLIEATQDFVFFVVFVVPKSAGDRTKRVNLLRCGLERAAERLDIAPLHV